jgi:hypothetical protein
VCNHFVGENATDSSKMGIHYFRNRIWRHLRPEVKEWTLANWARFEREQPDWFNAACIGTVPDDMIPPGSLEGLRRAGGGKRRKSSVSERVLGTMGASGDDS